MKNIRVFLLLAVALLSGLPAGQALAGPYADELAKCLVRSTTSADQATLVQWMFAMVALHPNVKSMASVSDEQRTEVVKATAQLFQRLLTEACVTQAREALKQEGPRAIEQSFNVLGQVASRELFADPAVAGGLSQFGQYMDAQAIERALGKTP